ncbi:M6 family metalloprotease domain-containing protein [Streptomyces yaizuensis]|uniref:M6 family metalloprotease domain-containing protein n=1 Tax=Streptomyces yaizuensis TaxID=2989713 RepID=A0ABQ5PAI2_9ACTN|nr:M6 family metalloprotease domain-containing protein [Streptomyces sp. YSPA8]GLF99500.1 M6 family metalloprotease domain-containing protein [Streptomyces sp. YSPA8]
MRRGGRHRIPGLRHVGTLAALTAFAFAALTTSGGTPTAPVRTAPAGPAAVPGRPGVGLCRIAPGAGIQMSEGMPTPVGYSRSTGEVRALNLMIDFPDAPGEGKALDRLAEFFPQTSEWFSTSSYGRLRYRPYSPIRTWLRMPLRFEEYGIERGAPYDPAYRKLVDDMITVADPDIDFSAYDLVNILVTPNAGPSALDTVLSVTFSGNAEAPVADGVPLANTSFVYSRQDDGSGTHAETGYRVLPHENGHVFGLPDLYTSEGGASVGHWDIMSEDWGVNNDLLAWHKWKLGWLDNEQITCASAPGSSIYTLTPLFRPGGRKMTYIPLTEDSGYAVEVRARGGNDEAVCDPGVLVYRVHGGIDTGEGPVTVMDSDQNSGGCTRRPNVHAELSDAPFQPGETFTDREHGVKVAVISGKQGEYRIRVTRA